MQKKYFIRRLLWSPENFFDLLFLGRVHSDIFFQQQLTSCQHFCCFVLQNKKLSEIRIKYLNLSHSRCLSIASNFYLSRQRPILTKSRSWTCFRWLFRLNVFQSYEVSCNKYFFSMLKIYINILFHNFVFNTLSKVVLCFELII